MSALDALAKLQESRQKRTSREKSSYPITTVETFKSGLLTEWQMVGHLKTAESICPRARLSLLTLLPVVLLLRASFGS